MTRGTRILPRKHDERRVAESRHPRPPFMNHLYTWKDGNAVDPPNVHRDFKKVNYNLRCCYRQHGESINHSTYSDLSKAQSPTSDRRRELKFRKSETSVLTEAFSAPQPDSLTNNLRLKKRFFNFKIQIDEPHYLQWKWRYITSSALLPLRYSNPV